jgi:hypothetical protein
MQNNKTTGTPNVGIVRTNNMNDKLSDDEQKLYTSAVGSLLQLVMNLRPDLANVVRELSTPAAFKEMKRVMKFVFDTKDYGLKIYPRNYQNKEWIIKAFSDSD